MKHFAPPHKQYGATLFVALILLLILTILAVASKREATLEARITGNLLEQKRLSAAAEAGLREGERALAALVAPAETCIANDTRVCITGLADTYNSNFSASNAYSSATLNRSSRWYVRDSGLISSPTPDCFLTGKGCTNYYEVNSQSFHGANTAGKNCGADALCMRSVRAVIFN